MAVSLCRMATATAAWQSLMQTAPGCGTTACRRRPRCPCLWPTGGRSEGVWVCTKVRVVVLRGWCVRVHMRGGPLDLSLGSNPSVPGWSESAVRLPNSRAWPPCLAAIVGRCTAPPRRPAAVPQAGDTGLQCQAPTARPLSGQHAADGPALSLHPRSALRDVLPPAAWCTTSAAGACTSRTGSSTACMPLSAAPAPTTVGARGPPPSSPSLVLALPANPPSLFSSASRRVAAVRYPAVSACQLHSPRHTLRADCPTRANQTAASQGSGRWVTSTAHPTPWPSARTAPYWRCPGRPTRVRPGWWRCSPRSAEC